MTRARAAVAAAVVVVAAIFISGCGQEKGAQPLSPGTPANAGSAAEQDRSGKADGSGRSPDAPSYRTGGGPSRGGGSSLPSDKTDEARPSRVPGPVEGSDGRGSGDQKEQPPGEKSGQTVEPPGGT